MNAEQEIEFFDAHVRHATRAAHIEQQIELWASELGHTLAFLHVLNVLGEAREASMARLHREVSAVLGQ
ncbi:hypothetical protein [Mycobacteroides abscessus]|uniref:hypothetical protein n=1 Tax=Mycobacteroides abscessus TaxID=36809 RepID=UPI0019D31AD0|nr:hypothetical protein [Mycobacteroides abscessus]MBN7315109.1 hypothetical protein [Mycobacteroides abscessus subsp. abscessus]